MSLAQMMLIPPAVTPSVNSVPSDYRTDQKATDKPPFPPKRLFNHPPDSQAVAEPKSSRLGSTHKSASEGFATPPSSAFLGAFKAPLSVPPSVNFGLNACLSPEPTSVQNNRPYHYGSPEISEIDDLEFDTSKGKVTLWQFLLQLLLDPRYSDIIRWTNNAGEFVLLRAEEVARLWGLRKDNNHRMNYDKLSRALRYYYQKNIIRKVQGHKFVYQFIGLHRLRGLMRLHAADKLPADSYFSTDHIRPHRRQSASAKSLSSISPEGHLNEFSPFQKPNHFDSFPGPPFSCSPKSSPMTLSTQESSKFSLHLPNSFSPTLNPQLSLGTSNTSVLHSPPMELSDPTSDFARACTSLQKNSEALHYSMASKDNVDAIASLACKEVLRALIPNRPSTDRSARRQSSPNCHCSCHCSAATNKLVETHPPHFSPPSLTPQKPRSTECWPPTNEGLQEDTLSSSTSDHRSYLHWQRHMINMNRLKEQIQRVAGGEDRKPPIFRPFDSPQSDPLKHGEVGSVRRAPASSDDRSGNYIWMPIQVDLVGHFMTMLSQSLQSHQPREPPPAHSTSSPSSSSSSSSNANTSSVTHG